MTRIAIALVLAITLCSWLITPRVRAASLDASEWLHFRSPSQIAGPDWHEIPISSVHSVLPSTKTEAVRLLSDRSYRELSAQEAAKLSGTESLQSGSVQYLLRAVRNSGTHGAYKLLTDGKAVVVKHGSLAKHTSLESDALVVELPHPPTAVFVEVNIAE